MADPKPKYSRNTSKKDLAEIARSLDLPSFGTKAEILTRLNARFRHDRGQSRPDGGQSRISTFFQDNSMSRTAGNAKLQDEIDEETPVDQESSYTDTESVVEIQSHGFRPASHPTASHMPIDDLEIPETQSSAQLQLQLDVDFDNLKTPQACVKFMKYVVDFTTQARDAQSPTAEAMDEFVTMLDDDAAWALASQVTPEFQGTDDVHHNLKPILERLKHRLPTVVPDARREAVPLYERQLAWERSRSMMQYLFRDEEVE